MGVSRVSALGQSVSGKTSLFWLEYSPRVMDLKLKSGVFKRLETAVELCEWTSSGAR